MSFFDTSVYAINRYEDELPDMMLAAHQEYEKGNISAEDYANALRKMYAVLDFLMLGGKC